MATEKRCYKCKCLKPVEAFSSDKSRADKRQPRCKACYSIYKASRRKPRVLLTKEQIAEKRQAYADRNREKARQASKDWLKANKASFSEYAKGWRKANAVRLKVARQKWTEENRGRIRALNSAYLQQHKDRVAAHVRNRQARKLKATPAWANLTAMRSFYAEAFRLTKETGIAHHVDHIVPLKSPWVCGLHCEANLQVLTANENCSKSNRRWPHMWDCYEGDEARSNSSR